ncbi:MAG: response regulator [Cytophagales bacterium]|nr:response regulator [Cytophagales bacterium]
MAVTKTLLIVEDSESVKVRLLGFLAEIKCIKVLAAVENGNTAFWKIMQEMPDIVLLDIQVPGLNGLEILDLLRELKQPPLIIVLTNNSDDYFKERCMKSGATAFFDKTTQFEQALTAIENLCHEGPNP